MHTLLDREGSDRPERRSALVDRELNIYNVDMAALSETRLADVGEAAEANYTFFWSGRAPHLKREAGVGFAIKTSLVPTHWETQGYQRPSDDSPISPDKKTLCYTNKYLCSNHAVL